MARAWTGERDAARPAAGRRWTPGDRWREADAENLADLRAELGEPAFRWLCACAVYHELHWDLTLLLADVQKLSAGLREPLHTEANRLRLVSLDWFREGSIPDEWRWLLVRQLRPEQENAVRDTIWQIIKDSPADKDSAAAARRHVVIGYNGLLPERDQWKGWLRLRRWGRQTSPEEIARDVVVLRSLDSLRRSPLDLVLPEFVCRMFHEKGVSLFGLKTVVRFLLVTVAAVLAVTGVYWAESSIRSFASKFSETLREDYVAILPGEFSMGCSPGDSQCFDDEKPGRSVRLTKGFLMVRTEVTVENYRKFVQAGGPAPEGDGLNRTGDHPITGVTWEAARAYCAFTGGRLPTEAEWEYAARGQTTTARYGPLEQVAWYFGNSGGATHPVGTKSPNIYGLFDMLGNVWEWTADRYGEQYYRASPATDPKGPASGDSRVVRGGSWGSNPVNARASNRVGYLPVFWGNDLGFRCVREVP
ncbi:MAG: hypothetical protein EXQ52_05835 [Bryobacterales bacterium]|nr:hypothetical protein [Bryobacterales bacterium]